MAFIKSLDISNWTGELSPGVAQCLAAAGYTHCVVRISLEHPTKTAIARQQLAALRAVGIRVHGYGWMYPSWDPRQTVIDSFAVDDQIEMLWMDAEETDDLAPDSDWNVAWLLDAIDEIGRLGHRGGIYTGAWWWVQTKYMANSKEFANVPLWTAQYDGDPDPGVFNRYGGWTFPWGKQWQGSGTARACGLAVDFNTFTELILPPTPPPPPPPPGSDIPVDTWRRWNADDLGNMKDRQLNDVENLLERQAVRDAWLKGEL